MRCDFALGDNLSTDEILPAGLRVLPFRSNIPGISRFVFLPVDDTYYDRAMAHQETFRPLSAGRITARDQAVSTLRLRHAISVCMS